MGWFRKKVSHFCQRSITTKETSVFHIGWIGGGIPNRCRSRVALATGGLILQRRRGDLGAQVGYLCVFVTDCILANLYSLKVIPGIERYPQTEGKCGNTHSRAQNGQCPVLYFDCVDLSKPKDVGRIDLWVDGFFF